MTYLREKFNDSLQQSTQGVFGICNQVVEQENRFFLEAEIPFKWLNPVKAALEGDSRGDLGTSAPGAATLSLLLFFVFSLSLSLIMFVRLLCLRYEI